MHPALALTFVVLAGTPAATHAADAGSSAAPQAKPHEPATSSVDAACTGASIDLRPLFEHPGACAAPFAARDGISAADLAALRTSLKFDPPRVKPGAKLQLTVRFENRGTKPVRLPFRRPCDGQVALREFEPNRDADRFGLGDHLLLRLDAPITCRDRQYEIESVAVVLPPGGTAFFTAPARASYDADPWPRDAQGFPIGREPRPHPLRRGRYTFVTDPGFSVPMDGNAMPGYRHPVEDVGLRTAWYPALEGALEVK